ncbi:amino acid adenylation domain-containing protein [Streptomyces sp. Je 1-369]|uniref:amino acid adenylation domain-containing protein n=1 Tax=Streptomyces sp. Je 1-369 TaxID=2966192 RepID=UPI002286A850|nr:amino acid adenylation domain-containing protein [Streptomyces sp. Je 1-369]WAL98653.1 amino acid adenylation domain-containing protein [Streptomyces sp. Je 1-369]
MGSPTARPAAGHDRARAGYDRARHGIHNLRRAEVIADPGLYWRAISELPPVFYDEVGGVWVCAGYAESVEILANHRAFSSARHHSPDDLAARGMSGIVPTAEMLSAQFLFNDPPDHTRIRNALRAEFSPAGLQRHDPDLRAIADRALDALPDAGTIDLVRDFAERLPEHLMTHLLGMRGRGAELTEWADAYERLLSSVSTFPSRADLETVPLLDKALAGLRELAAERLAAPGDDLVSVLATALRDDFAADPAKGPEEGSEEGSGERSGEPCEPSAELLQLVAANALVLVAGGYQTLTHLVSSGLLLLAEHPEQLRRLRDDPSLADSAVAEVLRIDGSSQYVGRHAVRDIEVGGARMKAGDGVLVLLAAANLDPRKFTDPTAFDITRSEGRHLGFGSGPHYCLGAPFAERLARWAILGFVERYRRFGLSPVEADPVEWGPHCNTRSRRRAALLVGRTAETAPREPHQPDAVPAAKTVTDLERHQIVAEWNDTGADDGAAQICWQLLFEERARLAPDSTAVEDEGVVYSYADIDALANGAAHRLRELGVEPETVVAISMERSVRLVVAILAVAKAGGAFLLAASDCPGERLRTMLEQTSARLVVADDATGDRIAALGLPADVVRLDPAARAAAPPITGVAPGNTAYVVFTSGTTGRPKAIANSHESLTNLHLAQRAVFRIRPQDRVLQFLSLNFDGFISEAVLALLCGATLVVARTAQLTPGPPLSRLLRERRVSVAIMTPSVWSVLAHDPLPNLRIAAFAGERLPGALVRRWTAPGRRLLNLYGPAEAAVWSTWHECAGEDDPPIGRPVAGKRVYVLDEERQLLPAGTQGELYIAGIGVGRYLGRPDLMAESFMPDPFAGRPGRLMYRSGDLCVWREDGSLEYVGRRDRQVKIRGQRVELYEVERVLEKAPGVSSCHAVERDGRLHAFVVPEGPGSWDETAVRRHLAERLHGGMIPAAFTVTEQLPLTSNGKVGQREETAGTDTGTVASEPAPIATAPAPVPVAPAPAPAAPAPVTAGSTRVTWELARLFSSCLRVPQVQVKLDTDFFSAGGDSLAMAEFMAAAEDRFGMEIDIQRLLDEPTLAGLVQLVSEGRTAQ